MVPPLLYYGDEHLLDSEVRITGLWSWLVCEALHTLAAVWEPYRQGPGL